MKHLENYGWRDELARHVEEGELGQVARVVQEHKEAYWVESAVGAIWAEISGKMRHEGVVRADYPAVGDWVVLRGVEKRRQSAAGGRGKGKDEGPVQIARILPRKTVLARRVDAGHEQVLAVNVDVAFLGASLNENFNVRRLERYWVMARDAGVMPVVLLTKADVCEDAARYVAEVKEAVDKAGGGSGFSAGEGRMAIHKVSVVSGEGLAEVRGYLKPGVTAVLLGSSGIGKSTLVNHLAESDIQDMMEVREFDAKGRHCTTFRHLVRTASGGLIIDTPGLRGLGLGSGGTDGVEEAAEGLRETFGDIERLAAACRFGDCGHDTEPGCAIKTALESGALDAGRLESYRKLRREMEGIARRERRVEERKQKKRRRREDD